MNTNTNFSINLYASRVMHTLSEVSLEKISVYQCSSVVPDMNLAKKP